MKCSLFLKTFLKALLRSSSLQPSFKTSLKLSLKLPLKRLRDILKRTRDTFKRPRDTFITSKTIQYCAIVLLCYVSAMSSAPVFAQSKLSSSIPTKAMENSSDRPIDKIIAVVNSEVITRNEMLERLHTVELRLMNQGVTPPSRDILEKQVLEKMIVERAQLQLAKESGIKIDDAQIDRTIEKIAEQNKISVAQFRDQLERDGIGFQKFRNELRNEITMARLREREVDNKIEVSESEIDNYLAANKAVLGENEYNLAHILIRVPDNASASVLRQRQQQADEILKRLQQGADFSKLALEISESPEAKNGGLIGWRNAEQLPQLFSETAAQLAPNQISSVLKSPNGFHILKLLDKRKVGSTGAANSVTQTHVRHILLKVGATLSAAEAKRKLLELKARLINQGAHFEELARLYSNDASAAKGGDLGWVYPNDATPEFERAMNALAINEISDPVETPFGLHLIQVLERKTDDVSPERLRKLARQALRERKTQEAQQDWLRQLRDRTYVEYRAEEK